MGRASSHAGRIGPPAHVWKIRRVCTAAIIVVLSASWWGLVVFTLSRVSPWLARPANRARLDRTAGLVLIAFGLWVVFVGA